MSSLRLMEALAQATPRGQVHLNPSAATAEFMVRSALLGRLRRQVLQLADDVAGGCRGYVGTSAHPCVRFPSGVGVQAHARTGSLLAIRQHLGAARQAGAFRELSWVCWAHLLAFESRSSLLN